ncbi:hypothetical protein BGW42_001412 [Actinomortierella wolfii]|nr:hypothetical protein BGW42_001412 [Actinomortierella wolfii]
MAESSELMRRRSIVESQKQVKISRDKHSPMNIIRMLTRVPGFVPAPRPSSGRGPIPGSENWRKLTPKSAKTRNFPLGDGEVDIRSPGEESSRSSSAVKSRLSNPFLATDQQDGESGEARDDLRHRDLTDVSMEYKLGSGGDDETNRRGDEEFEAGDALDDRYLVSTPGQNATEEGEAVAEDPFDMQMEESRRERALLVSEGDQTGEMSIGRLSQILGEKAVLNEEEADSQIPLDQDMEGERNMHDQALQDYDQQGQEKEAAFPEDGAEWNDIPEGADVQGDTAISEVEANSGEIAEVSGEEQGMEAQSEEYPQAEGEEPQDQNEDESGWQDVEEQEGNQNRRDNQTLFLDDLPSELGMLSNGQFLPVDAPKGKKNVRMSKNGLPVPSLPASLQRQLVHTFARTKMSREAMEEITEASHLFFEQVSGDLAAYAAHAGRRTIDDSDVECLMRRLRLTNSKVSLESLLHRYLPRELRDLVLYPKELRPLGQR